MYETSKFIGFQRGRQFLKQENEFFVTPSKVEVSHMWMILMCL